MDFDETRKIRRAAIFEPVIIGEPGIATRERNKLARARMV
jgi:hypothetical protein